MKARDIVVWGAALAAVVAAALWAFRPQPLSVEVAPVSKGKFEQTVDDDGKTRVRDRYIVSAPLAGRVLRIALRSGDIVAQGQVIAVILPGVPVLQDQRTVRELTERAGAAQASVSRAMAMEARAGTQLEQARADADRTRRLAAGGFVSPASLEQASLSVRTREQELAAARHEREAAEREFAQARAALTRMRGDIKGAAGAAGGFEVHAPISGRVLKVTQESEAAVAIGAPLIELGDVGRLEVVVDVLSTEAVGIPPAAPVVIDAGSDKPRLTGRVRLIEPSAFTKISALGVEEQRVNVIIDFTSAPDDWRTLGDGYRVDARIVVYAVDDVVLVPTGALFRDGATFAVFLVEAGVARKRAVEAPRRNERHAWVTRGLDAGAEVIMFPGDAVRDGVRVVARRSSP